MSPYRINAAPTPEDESPRDAWSPWTSWAIVAVAGLGFAMPMAVACGTPTAEHAKTAAEYEAEQLSCVDRARTLAESRACRCAHPAADGHVPDFCHDGGP